LDLPVDEILRPLPISRRSARLRNFSRIVRMRNEMSK
jgi:hypothetical protein